MWLEVRGEIPQVPQVPRVPQVPSGGPLPLLVYGTAAGRWEVPEMPEVPGGVLESWALLQGTRQYGGLPLLKVNPNCIGKLRVGGRYPAVRRCIALVSVLKYVVQRRLSATLLSAALEFRSRRCQRYKIKLVVADQRWWTGKRPVSKTMLPLRCVTMEPCLDSPAEAACSTEWSTRVA